DVCARELVARDEHDTHSSLAEDLLDFVAAIDDGAGLSSAHGSRRLLALAWRDTVDRASWLHTCGCSRRACDSWWSSCGAGDRARSFTRLNFCARSGARCARIFSYFPLPPRSPARRVLPIRSIGGSCSRRSRWAWLGQLVSCSMI